MAECASENKFWSLTDDHFTIATSKQLQLLDFISGPPQSRTSTTRAPPPIYNNPVYTNPLYPGGQSGGYQDVYNNPGLPRSGFNPIIPYNSSRIGGYINGVVDHMGRDPMLSTPHPPEKWDNYTCGRSEMMGDIVTKSAPYLYPFLIEFSLIGAAVLMVMWARIGKNPR